MFADVGLGVELKGPSHGLEGQAVALVVPGVLARAGLPKQKAPGDHLRPTREIKRFLEELREALGGAFVEQGLHGGQRGEPEPGEAAAKIGEGRDYPQASVAILDSTGTSGEGSRKLASEGAVGLNSSGDGLADPIECVGMFPGERRCALGKVGSGCPITPGDEQYGSTERLE